MRVRSKPGGAARRFASAGVTLLVVALNASGVGATTGGRVSLERPELTLAQGDVLAGAKEGDVDSDGRPEHIVSIEEDRVIAVRGDGTIVEIPGSPSGPSASRPATRSREGLVLPYQPGWPIVAGGVFYSSPVFVDIAGDEAPEILCGCSDDSLYAWFEDGSPVPGWPVAAGGEIKSSPAVGDIDGDGELEIVVGSWDQKVYAWNADGTTAPGFWPRPVNGVVKSSPAIGDVDQDGDLEVVVASFWGYSTGSLYVLEGDGSDTPDWPKHLGEPMESSPALADIDNDGKLEIVIGTESNHVYAFNGENATPVSGSWPVTTSGGVRAAPSIGDIDNDGHLEIVVGDSWWGGHTWAFEADGSVMDGWPIDVDNNVIASPALADFDCDGDLEIVQPTSIYFGSPVPCKIYVFHHDASVAENWPVFITGDYERTESSPAVANIDLDPEVEIVVGSGNGSGLWNDLYAFNYDGSPLPRFPLQGEDIYSSPAVGDIDRDGVLELAVGSWHDRKMHCWELGPGTFDPLGLPWPAFQHDAQHTSFKEYEGFADASVVVTADTDTVAAGEVFGYTVSIINNTDGEWTGMGLVMLALPGCVPYQGNPIVGPVAIALSPNQVLTAQFEEAVPMTAPPGSYVLTAAVGRPPDRLVSSGTIAIEVIAAQGGRVSPGVFPGRGERNR